jgi:cbb3-type cytochrome c oxidase subunit III
VEQVALRETRRRRRQAAALSVVSLVAALGLAACGDTVGYSTGSGDKIRGKELFTKNCGSCHTLADAGTTGKIGPNLDYAFVQSRIDGLGDDTILQVVRGQIAYPVTTPSTGAPGMPADIVEGQDAEDVAAYVASVAGLDAEGNPINPGNPPKPTPPGGGTDGKAIFASAGCSGCHTLAAAGASGTVGPNLDDAKPSKELAIDRVTNGRGGMPSFKGQLSEAQIQAVAAYVAENAGK